MNKSLSVVLLVVGVGLLVFGFNAAQSVSSDVSHAFTGNPTDKSVWFLVGGAVAAIVGLFGLFAGRGSKPL